MTDLPTRSIRREPPPFRRVTVERVTPVTSWLTRITFSGSELDGLVVGQPAASVRLLIPSPGESALVVPEWNGNEFLLPNGRRPPIRTFTPRRVDDGMLEADLDIVTHHDGVAANWARTAAPGDPAAMSGPGRGYEVDPTVSEYLVAGDETAVPAICQLLEEIPATASIRVLVEIGDADDRPELPRHNSASVDFLVRPPRRRPGETLAAAVVDTALDQDARVWAAGEAAAMQSIRRHLFGTLGRPRGTDTVRGYWKMGRAATK